MASPREFESAKWKEHVHRARTKQGGWYGRRYGKNPRWANPAGDAFRKEQREKRGK
jgi:hypothetical protein